MGFFTPAEKIVPRMVRLPQNCGKEFDVFIDTRTGVNYLRFKYDPFSDKAAGGLTVMYGADGKVLVSPREEIDAAIAKA